MNSFKIKNVEFIKRIDNKIRSYYDSKIFYKKLFSDSLYFINIIRNNNELIKFYHGSVDKFIFMYDYSFSKKMPQIQIYGSLFINYDFLMHNTVTISKRNVSFYLKEDYDKKLKAMKLLK